MNTAALRAKRQWDETMAASGAIVSKTKKRISVRAVKVSKALKVVDEETRRQVCNARLDALEADNYCERVDIDDDEVYINEEEEEGKKKKDKVPKKRMKLQQKGADEKKRIERRVKSLAQIVFEEYGSGETDTVNYITAAAAPSRFPPRKFCSVCGFLSSYTCKRCGSKFCSVKCNKQHQEMACMKFSM